MAPSAQPHSPAGGKHRHPTLQCCLWLAVLSAAPALFGTASAPPWITLNDVSAPWQLAFRHQASPTAEKYLLETMGSGVAIFDANGDGLLDLFRYGMLLIRARAPAAAVMRMEEAVRAHPASPTLWFALGLAHFSNHRNDEAASAFDRALELDGRFAAAHAYRGMTLVALGKFGEALPYFERALQLQPDLAVAHYLAGDALTKHTPPQLDRAETFLKRAVELNPLFTPAALALAKLRLQTDRYAEAAQELERIVAREPDLAEARYQLGRAYARLQRVKEAEAELAIFQRLTDEQRERAVTEREDLVRRLAAVRF